MEIWSWDCSLRWCLFRAWWPLSSDSMTRPHPLSPDMALWCLPRVTGASSGPTLATSTGPGRAPGHRHRPFILQLLLGTGCDKRSVVRLSLRQTDHTEIINTETRLSQGQSVSVQRPDQWHQWQSGWQASGCSWSSSSSPRAWPSRHQTRPLTQTVFTLKCIRSTAEKLRTWRSSIRQG